jgi:ribosomal protein S18 acetylase RimI-like enzyme
MRDAAPALRIRSARPDDMDDVHRALLALAAHIGTPSDVTSTPEQLRTATFADPPALYVDIAELDGSFAGMCAHFPIYSTWMGGRGVYVQDLYVDPARRGSAVGATLLRHVARRWREAGAVYLRLSVDADNLSAQRFYERLGIRHSEYERTHKILGDAFDAFCG